MSVLKTQSSSKPRLQNETLGNSALIELYKAYEYMDLVDFRIFAEGVVMAGGGKQPRKLDIISAINHSSATKAHVLTKAQNFILAGLGLGV